MSFDVKLALAQMQTGLTSNTYFSDYVYVLDQPIKKLPKSKADSLKAEIYQFILEHRAQYSRGHVTCSGAITSEPVIFAFSPKTWNGLFQNKVEDYDPKSHLEDFPEFKRTHYNFDIGLLIQIKKQKRDEGKGIYRKRNQVTLKILQLLKSNNLEPYVVEGQARQSCGVTNAIMAGHYNDNIQKPKDPYTFYLNCLIENKGDPHFGGSWLLAQKCIFDWDRIHDNLKNMPAVLGRNDIPNASSIFSENHCPHAHIRVSRVKDQVGNPCNLFRQSKSFTMDDFPEVDIENTSDLIRPEQGIFFIGYQKDPDYLQKMINSQLGTDDSRFQDDLMYYFSVDHGNILYVPSRSLLIKECEKVIFKPAQGKKSQGKDSRVQTQLKEMRTLSYSSFHQISLYHSTNWLATYKKAQQHEKQKEITCNDYFIYSRAEYMKKMTEAQDDEDLKKQLIPPSPRILRLLSKTFALWQDTWYYDRKQREFGHLKDFIQLYPNVISNLKAQSGYTGVISVENYDQIPLVIRNGLAIFFNLGYVVSTKEYGCRGNVDGDINKPFGANTFHLEPQDLLAGGEANLTFGQGKHLIQYLTQEELRKQWMTGTSLSAHSGIGHVNPYMEEIMQVGLQEMISRFKRQALKMRTVRSTNKYELFMATVFTLLGMQQYFKNYAKLALDMSQTYTIKQEDQKNSLLAINKVMTNLSKSAPQTLVEGAQLVLSVFICLHLTGEPVSLGRLDHTLRKFAAPIADSSFIISQEQQDVIDCFWIKVGEKANFNKTFFEDHQKWGNLAMGGSSAPYPQGASFNQWGQQLTVGGTDFATKSPFYNSVTISCLRAARRIPVNAPCLGLRVQKSTPDFIIEEASKAILAGGAHPILLNDDKIINGILKSGDYKIAKQDWDKVPVVIDGKVVTVPYENWNPQVQPEHAYDFGSDGCHEFLPIGRSWFWLGGGCALQPLEYVLNVGKSLLLCGPRFIHGKREHYKWRDLSQYQTYEEVEEQYFQTFEDVMSRGFFFQLSGFQNMTGVCPATLLNAFTADMIKRGNDFYQNGANYHLFCPQYTGLANLVNSLWNIKTLVFETKAMTLDQVRQVLLVNWGAEMQEPFISRTLPLYEKQKLFEKYSQWRVDVWNQEKFGLNERVTQFGLRIMRRMSDITRNIFEHPSENMLKLFKTLTYKFGSKDAPFGFQYLPGCGTFENFGDVGADFGASFDGRKKGQAVAEDLAPQNYLLDVQIRNQKFSWKDSYLQDILNNYNYTTGDVIQDPEFFSGAVVDFNIDQDYDIETLKHNIKQFAQGKCTNLITISTGSRKLLEGLRHDMDKDLMRFRQGGWSQFGISMFPEILEHHIRRRRSVAKPVLLSVTQTKKAGKKDKPVAEQEAQGLGKPQKRVKTETRKTK